MVRLPVRVLRRYRIGDGVVMEERSDGILLRPAGPASCKLSWDDTAKEMAASREDWSEWDVAAADGLDDLPWERRRSPRVTESPPAYVPAPSRRRKR